MVPARFHVGQIERNVGVKVRAGQGLALLWSIAATVALGTPGRAATTDTWTGAGTANWSDAASWNPGAPVSGNALVFDGTNQLSTNNNITGLTISGITFAPGAGAFVLANKGITLSGNVTDNAVSTSGSVVTQTISLPMVLSTNGTLAVTSLGNFDGGLGGTNLVISGAISQTGGVQGIIKESAGTVTLAGGNTYTGATSINAGVLALDYSAAPGGTTILNPSSAVVMGGYGSLLSNGNAANVTSQSINGLTLNARTNSSILTATAGAAHTLNLGAINRGTAAALDFQIGSGTSVTTTTANGGGTIMGAFYTANGSWAVSAGNGVSPGAVTPLTTFDTAFTPNADEDITATAAAPAGTLTLNSIRFSAGANAALTLGGPTTVATGGILNVTANESGNGSSITGNTLTSGNGELVINNRITDNFSIGAQLIGNMNLTIVNQRTNVFNEAINGAPDGSVILSNATNSFTGNVTVASGRLQINNAGQLGNPANPVFVVGGMNGGGQIQDNNGNITATNVITISGLGTAEDDGGSLGAIRVRNRLNAPIVLSGIARIGAGINGGTATYAGPISGPYELWLDSDAATHPIALTNGNNTWSGGTRIERGVVKMGVLNGLPQSTIVSFGTLIPQNQPYSAEGRTGTALTPTLDLAGFDTTIGGAQVYAGDTAMTGTVITNTSATVSANLTVNSTTSTTFSGQLTNGAMALTLVKTGAANFTLTGANNYTGGTTVTAGTLIAANVQALGTGPVVIHTGGKLQFQSGLAQAAVVPSVTFDGSTGAWSGTLDLTNNKLVIAATASHATAVANLQDQSHSALTSSTMAANYGIAVIDNGALATPFVTFGGQPVDGNSILVSPEILGDANADGKVDLTDLSTVLNKFGSSTPAWTDGNFDGQPTIDLTDLSAVLNNFGATNPNPSVQSAIIGIATPEPGSLAVGALGAAAFLRRRSKR